MLRRRENNRPRRCIQRTPERPGHEKSPTVTPTGESAVDRETGLQSRVALPRGRSDSLSAELAARGRFGLDHANRIRGAHVTFGEERVGTSFYCNSIGQPVRHGLGRISRA